MIKKVVSFIFGLLIFNISLNLRAQEIVGPDKGDLKDLILLKINKIPANAGDLKIQCVEKIETGR